MPKPPRRLRSFPPSRVKNASKSSPPGELLEREAALSLSLSKQVGQGTLELMREHPVFESSALEVRAQTSDSALGKELHEDEREAMFEREMLRIFRGRIQLVCLLGITFLPLFTAFYFVLALEISRPIIAINIALVSLLALSIAFAPLVKSLRALRSWALLGYIVFNGGAGLIVSLVSRDSVTNGDAESAIQFVILASFVQILLAILMLPFALWEALLATLVSIIAVTLGSALGNPGQASSISLAQTFLVVTTSAFVLTLSYFGWILRRQAFDAAFDLALGAARLREITLCDAVTGGSNRRHIESLLASEFARAARFHHPVSLIMFDLDNFKTVNDTLGHPAGDEVLREVHEFTSSLLREVDTVGRIGGDEFVVILPQTSSRAACYLAQRILNATSERLRLHFGPHSAPGQVTLSAGVLTLETSPLPSVDEAIAAVDELLYTAKRDGKNRVVGAQR